MQEPNEETTNESAPLTQANSPIEQGERAPAAADTATRRRLSRRGFLLTAAGAGAAAVAAACGRERPPVSTLPTPTSTSTATQVSVSVPPTPVTGHERYFPLVRNGVEPAEVAIAPTATPTETPAPPTETPTPEPPTPTPTPQATPFPPGPPSKLGLHVERNDPQIFDLIATQAVPLVKTLELDTNFIAQIKATSPNTNIVARINMPQADLANFDPAAAARDYMAALMNYADDPERRKDIAGWESYNEPIAGNLDEMKRLADFEAERTRLMAAEGRHATPGEIAGLLEQRYGITPAPEE